MNMKARSKVSAVCVLVSLFAGAGLTAGYAAEVPEASVNDAHIRVVQFKPDDVTLIRVQRGAVTRIVLEQGERIETPAVGISSDCKSEADEWCISAIVGTNQIFVRPRERAERNNMELHTNRRDYSFAFEVISDGVSHGKRWADVPFYRVVFEYAAPKPVSEPVSGLDRAAAVNALLARVDSTVSRPLPQSVEQDYGLSPVERLKAQGVEVRNSNYTKQVLERGEDASPTMVFDDGRFTYFEFPGAREIPAVFAYGSDGQETRVNWHMNGNFVVVQRTARKFTLRLGEAVVGVFNESFDDTGIETPTATVSQAVVREIKGEAQ